MSKHWHPECDESKPVSFGNPKAFCSTDDMIDWNKRGRCVMPRVSAVQSPEKILWLMAGSSFQESHTSALHFQHLWWLHLRMCVCVCVYETYKRSRALVFGVWFCIYGVDYSVECLPPCIYLCVREDGGWGGEWWCSLPMCDLVTECVTVEHWVQVVII